MDVLLVGLNHKSAPIEVRERLAFSEEEIPAALPKLRALLRAEEVLLLSTCNRTEALLVSRSGNRIAADAVVTALWEARNQKPTAIAGFLYEYRDDEAVRHLFRVAAGLDSMVLGEPQILGQTRQAYALAAQAGTNGLYVNKIMHSAFHTGKRVRNETGLGYGAVSVAYVAITLARKVFGKFQSRTALIIGAGEMAEAAARHLKEQQIGGLVFANRTVEKAEQMALAFDGEARPLSDLSETLERVDIVVASTGSPNYIVTRDVFQRAIERRGARPIFLIDLAIPRDIDPAVKDDADTFLYDLDSLREVSDQNLAGRRAAIPDAEDIVEQEMVGFGHWKENLRVEPLVKLLHERFDQVRKDEIGKGLKNFREREAEDLERLTLLIQKKLLHRPTEFLRQCDSESEEGRRVLEVVRDLFDLR